VRRFGTRHVALVGLLLADDEAEHGRLAGAVGAGQADLLAGVELQRCVDEQDLVAVTLVDAGQGDHRGRRIPTHRQTALAVADTAAQRAAADVGVFDLPTGLDRAIVGARRQGGGRLLRELDLDVAVVGFDGAVDLALGSDLEDDAPIVGLGLDAIAVQRTLDVAVVAVQALVAPRAGDADIAIVGGCLHLHVLRHLHGERERRRPVVQRAHGVIAEDAQRFLLCILPHGHEAQIVVCLAL
jgi:hypothetical protein